MYCEKNINSYEAARKMLPFAYDTDGLLSEQELGRGSRKKKKKVPFSFDEDSDNQMDQENIKMPKKTGAHQSRKQLINQPLPPPPQLSPKSRGKNLLDLLKRKRDENVMKKDGASKKNSQALHSQFKSSVSTVTSDKQLSSYSVKESTTPAPQSHTTGTDELLTSCGDPQSQS
ncbi:Complement C4-B, partial [Frankliniella fusca]